MNRSNQRKLFERRREVGNEALLGCRAHDMDWSTKQLSVAEFVGCAQRHGVVAPNGVVVAPKYRFCATAGLEWEFCVSHSCVRRSIDFRTIPSDRKKLAESRKCGDASAGLHGGSGEHRSLAMKSQSFEKLRMCAMRGC